MVPVSACPGPIRELMEICWEEHAELRYTFSRVRELLSKALGKSGENIIEHLINQMDQYATELEHDGTSANTIPYPITPYHTILYHTIPYHTIPYHTIPYPITPYHTIPYHTIP
jgi:hypothetical protein